MKAILRTYETNDSFIDKEIDISTMDDILNIEENQTVIDPNVLKDKYWKMRYSKAFARPGKVFYPGKII